MRLVVTRKSHSRPDKGRLVTYFKGDQFNGSQKELDAFGDRLKEVPQARKKKKRKARKNDTTNSGASEGNSSDRTV